MSALVLEQLSVSVDFEDGIKSANLDGHPLGRFELAPLAPGMLLKLSDQELRWQQYEQLHI